MLSLSAMTLSIITLGCSKNTVDSEHLLALLPKGSYSIVEPGSRADVLLVNTCGFIGDAKEQSIEAVLEAVEAKKAGIVGRVIVFGCLSQRYEAELREEIPEVDGWFGARDLAPVARALGFEPVCGEELRVLTDPSLPYAFLKISEGCDRRCSYCAIPYIRGPHRSVPFERLETEAEELASKGVRELVLIAQDSTYYGLDIYGRRALAELLRRLSAVPGIERLRVHYSYPDDFPEDVLDEMASNPKVCKYIDIPLQHISDGVLHNMHRGVTGAWTRALVKRMREKVPGVTLRTTFIVGHPGEGEKEFQELLDFVREARFDRMGAFAYSEEDGTWGAAHLEDSVPAEEKQRRMDVLMSIQAEISSSSCEARVGGVELVLADAVRDGFLVCRGEADSPEVDGEISVKVPEGCSASEFVGKFLSVRITGASDYDLEGEIVL